MENLEAKILSNFLSLISMLKNTETIFMICFNAIKQQRTKKKHNTNNKQAITVISIIITVKIQHNVLCLFP